MKKKILFLFSIITVLTYSCKIDNYDPPTAHLFGKIVDTDGNPVQSDISNSGVKITYIEKGNFSSPQKQSITLKRDGTYRNNMMFAGTYDVFIKDANFLDVDTVKNMVVKAGDNELNFTVQPYIKIQVDSMKQVGTMVIAYFKMQTLYNNLAKVAQIQLFSYLDPVVSFGATMASSPATTLNRVVGANEEFTLQIDLSKQSNTFTKYPTGTKFWFRVGAMVMKSDASAGSTPKWNYAEPVQMSLTL